MRQSHLVRAGAAALVFAAALIAAAPATSAASRSAAGDGAEPAAAHTGVAAVLQGNGPDQNVYHARTNSQIYTWQYGNNLVWSNKKL
jgi:hypothetical protein